MSRKISSTFTMENEDYDKIVEMAKASRRNRSAIVRMAVDRYYKHFKEEWTFKEKEVLNG